MLRQASKLEGFHIDANDGDIGKVEDLYFDDRTWTIRYLIVSAGSWLDRHRVLLSPLAIRDIHWPDQALRVNLTRAQIEESPDIDLAEPVSRQREHELRLYYNWPLYWDTMAGMEMAAAQPHLPVNPGVAAMEQLEEAQSAGSETLQDNHLRSIHEIRGYHIQATDGEIGHVDDFFVNEEDWRVVYMMVDTRNWWPGRKVLIAPQWVQKIDWAESKVYIDHERQAVKDAPEYDPREPISRSYESNLWDYYGTPGYWV